jgi:uncharacterized protein (DUF1015 family)
MNLSPIFSLYDDPDNRAREALALITEKTPPYAEFVSPEGTAGKQPTSNRLWRVTDADVVSGLRDVLAGSELLIADGHHRYEVARTYAAEVGGHGPHEYVLMTLVALQDPGLTVFPTHRLVFGLNDEQRTRLKAAFTESWTERAVTVKELEAWSRGTNTEEIEIGFFDPADGAAILSLKDRETINRALADKPAPYRELDTAVLETLLLKNTLGMTDEGISHHQGLDYAHSVADGIARVKDGKVDAAFLTRPTPTERIRAIAATGVNMPPKTTYFYPKIPTGIVFNPLS